MTLKTLLYGALLAVLCGPAAAQPAWNPQPADFLTLSGPASPLVSYALSQGAGKLQVALNVGLFSPEEKVRIQVGLDGAKQLILTNADGRETRAGNAARFLFTIPTAQLGTSADLGKLRFAVTVAWESGLPGVDRQRERFLQDDFLAPHDGMAPPGSWRPLNLVAYGKDVSARKNRIELTFNQPMDGKATIVIENAAGERVRNLVSALPLTKGTHQITWDGLNDDGQVIAPGSYRWRAVAHLPIEPHHLFTFAAGPGSNHGVMHAAASNSTTLFVGTAVSEGGHQIVGFDADGKPTYLLNPPLGAGLSRAALAADANYLYVAKDGTNWGEKVDKKKPDWKQTYTVSLLRYDLKANDWVNFSNRTSFSVLSTQVVGPGSPDKRSAGDLNLQGLALLDGKLYVSCAAENALLVVDPSSGKRLATLPLPEPGAVATDGTGLVAVTKGAVVRVDGTSGHITPLIAAGALDVRGITVDKTGQLYLSDEKSSTVKVYSATGHPVKVIGTPGGQYAGAYDATRMVHPRGLAFGPDGDLWVTEDRCTPKRYVAWNVATDKVAREYFGRTYYGATGAGIDPADATRWAGLGALWKLDYVHKTAYPTAILGAMIEAIRPTHYRFLHQDGRTFLIGYGKCTFISELQKDGSVKDLAMLGTVSGYAHDGGWTLPAPWMAAFVKAYPELKGDVRQGSVGTLWVDTNGDGKMEEGEFQFAKSATRFGGGYWGSDFRDLNLRTAAVVDGKNVLVAFKPQGYWPGGAPRYPNMEAALQAAVPLPSVTGLRGGYNVESMTDRFGDIFFNTDPKMTSFTPEGKLRWTYPNRWSGVGGSHSAPLPERGVMQGVLFFTGMAPLDAQSDVFVLNGNHGRLFLFTSDGLYLDEMFRDVRMGGADDVYRAGGEIFGGIFEKSGDQYLLQVGGNEYRVFQVDGLNSVQRSQGTLTVTPNQVEGAEQDLRQKAAAVAVDRTANILRAATPLQIDGRSTDWKTPVTVSWEKSNQFPVSVRAAYDAKNLYLYYTVRDDSPWVNNGTDWQTLFKTGDSVDLQLGTNPEARPGRTEPVPGDLRLLIAPMGTKNVAVLYKHRVPGATTPVTFTSPWRSERVDEVKQLPDVQIAVSKSGGGYNLEASVPLADLGLTDLGGKKLRGDFGVIYGDTGGTVDDFRNYWSNQATALVNDVPGEIMLSPNLWGSLMFWTITS